MVNMMKKRINKKTILGVIALVSVIIISVVAVRAVSKSNANGNSSSSDRTIDTIEIGETYIYDGLDPDNTDNAKGDVEMTIVKARKMSEVFVQGESVEVPDGNVFVTIDLELYNPGDETVGFFSRDMFRLLENEKPFSPQFYNKGIPIAPISVKTDRVAFLTEDADVYTIQVGPVGYQTETLTLQFNE